MKTEHLEHTLAPYYQTNSRILILGSFPSPKSRELGFYYGHPQNRFWPVLAAIAKAPVPESILEKKALLNHMEIALWDVLASCSICGASDASIGDMTPNDLPRILDAAHIARIYTTGKKAADSYKRFWGDRLGIPMMTLPSTSAANCRMSLSDLCEAYGVILQTN